MMMSLFSINAITRHLGHNHYSDGAIVLSQNLNRGRGNFRDQLVL